MNRLFLIIISFLCLFSISNAEIVKNYYSGNKRVSPETVKIYGEIKINKDYQEKDIT